MIKAGCEFSVAQELLLLAPGEATAAYESGVGRKNAEGSVAPPGTRGRESQGSLARGLVQRACVLPLLQAVSAMGTTRMDTKPEKLCNSHLSR
jgi:hypothetical protein